MKRIRCVAVFTLFAAGLSAVAQPVRVALSDFQVTAGLDASALTAQGYSAEALAEQGAFLLGKSLLNQGRYEVVDRRELQQQLTRAAGEPLLIRAAQQVNADVLLEGRVQSFSTRRQQVNQGGYQSDHQELQMRIGIEARDTVSGSVVAMASGSTRQRLRQTAALQTQLGEEDLLVLLEQAIQDAAPELNRGIEAFQDQLANREKVLLSIQTEQDPALVEIDGLLMGSTPLTDLPVYKGDHVIVIGKAGHRDVVKRIQLNQDTQLSLSLIRTELDAEEVKEILSGARINAYLGLEPALLIEHIQTSEE